MHIGLAGQSCTHAQIKSMSGTQIFAHNDPKRSYPFASEITAKITIESIGSTFTSRLRGNSNAE